MALYILVGEPEQEPWFELTGEKVRGYDTVTVREGMPLTEGVARFLNDLNFGPDDSDSDLTEGSDS